MSASLKFRAILSTAALLLICCVPLSRAAYIINIDQVGPDVVATGSGSLDLAALTAVPAHAAASGLVEADNAQAGVGSSNVTDVYLGLTGPTSFGPGAVLDASSTSGPIVAVSGGQDALVVPGGYSSATPLGTSTDTFSNQTFSTMGLDPGTYTYSLPNDTFTVQIGPAVVSHPLPAGAWAAMLAIPIAFAFRRKLIPAA